MANPRPGLHNVVGGAATRVNRVTSVGLAKATRWPADPLSSRYSGGAFRAGVATLGRSGCREESLLPRKPYQRSLQLFERPNLDLADALAADVIDLA